MNLTTSTLEDLRKEETRLLSQQATYNDQSTISRQLCGVHVEISQRCFPDLHYLDYLKKLHQTGAIENYMEIGVFEGQSLRLKQTRTKAIGVDPDYKISTDIAPNTSLYKLTSDAFFENYSSMYRGTADLVFVDGLHEANQSLRDIYNSFRLLKEDGQIIVHDVLPISPVVATANQDTLFWTGDVWLAASAICYEGAPFKWELIPAAPSGLLRLYDIDPKFEPNLDFLEKRLKQARNITFESLEDVYSIIGSV